MRKLFSSSVLFISLSLISCSLSSPLPGILGSEVRIDKETGHFNEDLEYIYNDGGQYYSYTFSADGGYAYTLFSWDTGSEEWITDSGLRGSYIYNADTMVLSILINEEYTLSSAEWTAPVWAPYIKTWHAYFTTANWYGKGRVLIADTEEENKWFYVYTYEDAEQETYSETCELTLTPEPGGPFKKLITGVNADTTGEWDKDQTQISGTVVSLYPEGTKFRRGDTGTFSLDTEKTIQDWNPDTDWGGWSEPVTERLSKTYLNMGSFLILSPTLAAGRQIP